MQILETLDLVIEAGDGNQKMNSAQCLITLLEPNLSAYPTSLVRNMQSLMSTMSPETIAAMSGGNMSPEMVKFATNMMKQMSPEDMERMVDLASSGQMPVPGRMPMPTSAAPSTPSIPETLLAAPNTTASVTAPTSSRMQVPPEASTRAGAQTPGTNMPSMADFSPEMQEQMRNQMKDPAMKQVGFVEISIQLTFILCGQMYVTNGGHMCSLLLIGHLYWSGICKACS